MLLKPAVATSHSPQFQQSAGPHITVRRREPTRSTRLRKLPVVLV